MVGANLGERRRTDTARVRHTDEAQPRRERDHVLEEQQGHIIVGIDGSAGSIAALDFALHFAEVTDLAIEAVTVYDPCPATMSTEWGPSISMTASLRRENAERCLGQAITNTSAGEHVVPSLRVLAGQPTEVLVDLSHSASFLVVGPPRRGIWHALSRGRSLSRQLARRAHCPLVVVSEAWCWSETDRADSISDRRPNTALEPLSGAVATVAPQPSPPSLRSPGP